MTDLGFIVAAYGVVFAALGAYVLSVWRRTRRAREASLRIRDEAGRATDA